jgi:ABC-type glycerol-3-phosphate transport system permease component
MTFVRNSSPRRPVALTPRHLRLGDIVQHVVLIVASLVALFPLWFMVWTAIRSQEDYFRAPLGWPGGIQWENFTRAFDQNIGRWIVNSTIVTGGAVLLVLLVSVPAAYVFVRLPFRGSDLLLKIFVFLMVIPPIVMLLPLFALMNRLGRVNHFDAVIVAYAGLMFPFSVFMMVRYIETIPQDLYEAAYVEGASHLRILWTIVVPLVVPALLTLGIVNALWAWNELLIAVVMLQREEARTLQAGLALLKGKNTMDIPLVMAGATISAIPLLLLYLFGQRVFMSGLLAGAVKE